MKRAVILLSGGLDSSTLAYVYAKKNIELIGLSFDYGQRHRRELDCARIIAAKLGLAEHHIVRFDLSDWKGSPLTYGGAIPLHRSEAEEGSGIPPTYVPARNLIFLSFAMSLAETKDCGSVLIGAHSDDHVGYPDCRNEFFLAFEEAARQGTRYGAETGRPIRIERPFVFQNKGQIVEAGLNTGLDYRDTWTCYSGEELACGACDSCRQRLRAFAAAGSIDPLPYVIGAAQ